MHVLSGFSTRRKSPNKPRDLHIRKVSFSGCSLSSGCSISSSSSTSTARGPSHSRSDSDASYDPLRLHPIVQPPPRLHDRPYIVSPKRQDDKTPRTFYNDRSTGSDEWSGYGVSIFEYDDSDTEVDDEDTDDVFEQVHSNSMPPMVTPMDHGAAGESDDEDYLFMQLAKRPPMPRSHWSESTIQTLAQLTPAASNIATPVERLEDPIEQARMMLPNFSRKHATVPARPRMKAMDSVEQLVKRGGWKRKALLLDNQEDVAPVELN